MSEFGRNRSEGWMHAKLSGHSNEELVKQLLDNNKKYATDFLRRINCQNQKIIKTSIGGLHETTVLSVTGKPTKSKTDLKIFLENGSIKNISIKKSLGGQVYFVGAGNLIEVFEKQFNKTIPKVVQRAINSFSDANLKVDGVIGKETIKAINSIPDTKIEEFMSTIKSERIDYLQNTRNWETAKNGWTKRTNAY